MEDIFPIRIAVNTRCPVTYTNTTVIVVRLMTFFHDELELSSRSNQKLSLFRPKFPCFYFDYFVNRGCHDKFTM